METPEIRELLQEHVDVMLELAALEHDIAALAERILACLQAGRKVCWMGNGGSAADSQHLAAEFVGRFRRERAGLPSLALTTDTSVLTAVANDYGYEQVFARQVEALCVPEDVVVGLSTSGNSLNVVRGLQAARRLGAYTIGLTGRSGGLVAAAADRSVAVPSANTARIQEAHILIGHLLCELVDREMTGIASGNGKYV